MTNVKSKHIQILRGIAIIAVVLIHTTPAGLCQVYLRPFLNFSVGLFLFLSGMLSNAENWNPKRRIKKVIIPYIIWTFIYVALNNINNLSILPKSFFINLITGKSAGMMYYIFIYCEFTLLIPLIDKLGKSKFKYLGYIITPIEIIFMRTIPLMTEWYEISKYINLIKGVSCLGWFTYFYLGYLLGNNLITISGSAKKWGYLYLASIPVQILEAYWQFSKGIDNCGSQMKLSTVLTGIFFVILAYKFINSDKKYTNKVLEFLGDNSFGIYFSHIAVRDVLSTIPLYSQMLIYPLNTIVVVAVNVFFIILGKKILGRYSKYLAL